MVWTLSALAGAALVLAGVGAKAQPAGAPAGPGLDGLLERYAGTPSATDGSVRIDAWVEGEGAERQVVIVLDPEGETKLVADPGITITPEPLAGVEWRDPLPVRLVDPARDYFDPPAMLSLDFTAEHAQPLTVLVEYAWCVVDYQCFFGEETLTVANRIE